MNEESTRGLGIGLLIGAAIGLAVGMLYAPQRGTETRHMLREKADSATSRLGDVADRVREKADAATSRVSDVAGRVKDRFRHGEEEVD